MAEDVAGGGGGGGEGEGLERSWNASTEDAWRILGVRLFHILMVSGMNDC